MFIVRARISNVFFWIIFKLKFHEKLRRKRKSENFIYEGFVNFFMYFLCLSSSVVYKVQFQSSYFCDVYFILCDFR